MKTLFHNLKNIKLFAITISFILVGNHFLGQNYNCGSLKSNGNTGTQSGSGCSGSDSAYKHFYSKQSFYVPTGTEPLITLKIVAHVFMPSTPYSWTNDVNNIWMGPNALKEMLEGNDPEALSNQSDRYSIQRQSSYSLNGFTVPFISDSRIKYEFTYYYYINDSLYNLDGYGDDIIHNIPNFIYHVNYIKRNYPGRMDEGLPLIFGNSSTPQTVGYNGKPLVFVDCKAPHDSASKVIFYGYNRKNIRHELGHCFNLWHAYQSMNHQTGESLNCINDPDFLSDLLPINNNSNCASRIDCDTSDHIYPTNPTCQNCNESCSYGTNNIMAAASYGDTRWMSPLQMGRRIRNMHLPDKGLREFAKEAQSDYFKRWIIYSDQTWDFDIQMYRDIEVKAGATLTIKCKVAMAADGRIIVNKGARLIIDGGLVTGWCKKTPLITNNHLPLWMGIEVLGNQNTGNYINSNGYCTTAGIVEVKNAGKVSYAQNGIFTCYCDPWGEMIPSINSGGIVISDGGIFENNIRDLVFFNYETGVTSSKIINSKFITTGLIGKDFNGNDIKPAEHIKLYKNTGLVFKGDTFQYAAGSIYQTSDRGIGIYSTDAQFNTDKSTLNGNSYRCRFENLTRGIYVDNINPLYSVYIFNSDFIDNWYGSLVCENQNNLLFMDNSIVNKQVYLYKTKYYTIKSNNFYGNLTNPAIIAQYSGTGAHQIYKNNFSQWYVAILAQENNGSSSPNGNGLKMNCNDFTFRGLNNHYDIGLTKQNEPMPLIMANQSPFNPQNPSALQTVRNIYAAGYYKWYVDPSSNQNIIHNFPSTAPATNPNNPQVQASSQIALFSFNLPFNYSQHCLTFPPSSGNISSSSHGNLADMNNYITGLRSNGENNENSDRDFEIQATVSSKLNYFLNDTTVGSKDSVVAILNNNQGNMDDADIQLIFAYLKNKDFNNATNKINTLPSSKNDWKELLTKVEQVEQDTLGAFCLLTNTALANYFAAYANDEGRDGQVVAQALMRFAFGTEHDYPIILPPDIESNGRNEDPNLQTKVNKLVEENYSVKIYPNPTQKGIHVLYSGNEEGNLKLEIKDLLGRLIFSNFIVKKEVTYLPLNELQNGVYMVSIKKADKKIIFQDKLIKAD